MTLNNVTGITILTDEEEKEITAEMSKYLIGMGIYPNNAGYRYVIQAVLIVVGSNGAITSMGTIYKLIAESAKKSIASVERSIRFVIEKSVNNMDILGLNEFFGFRVCRADGSITSGELIFLLADKIMSERMLY